MKARLIVLIGIVSAFCAIAPAQAARTKQVTVRGAWFNEVPIVYCYPGSIKPGSESPPTSVSAKCIGGSAYYGGWTGHTQTTPDFTLYENGDIRGTFDEWFYGVYTADGSSGGIHWRGDWGVDGATNAFWAEAKIVGGTCDFASSSGHASFTGFSTNGGYVATWSHPAGSSTQPCNPFVPPAVP